MPTIVYHRRYNIGFFGLEKLHPFDSRKYGRAWKVLKREIGQRLKEMHVRPRQPVSTKDLLLVHTADYLQQLGDSKYVAGALELPPVGRLPAWMIDRHVLSPMRWATQGTVLAAESALGCGLSINMSGGYHHAKPGIGEGFSIYNDIAIAVASLRSRQLISDTDRIVYVDTDAHQGNGVCHCFLEDSSVFIFDVFNEHIYPAYDDEALNRIDCPIGIDSSIDDSAYMSLLGEKLPGFLESVCRSPVGLAIYNAGTDVFANDPLGNLSISADAILERDLFAVSELRKRGIPTVMVLSGGYTKQSYQLVADSVIGLIEQEIES